MTASNLPPDDSPWLAAVTADVAQPGSNRFTVLPYHARLRGRFGEPTLAHCPRPERVFLVEAIVATYPTKPPPLPTPFWTVGPGHAAWPRHHEPRFGLSLAVPPGWGVEPLAEPETLGGLVVRMPGLESYPVRLRVHQGESWYDWYAPWSRPPFFDGAQSYGPYPQGRFAAWGPTQGLAGWHASRAFGSERGESVLFNGGGRTHELVLRYPTGYDVSQELLTGYTGIVEGFALDQHPGPTPTPPIKQALGPGPFLSEARARARVRELAGADVELLSARLIPEAEARGLSGLCNTFSGHPDGVWLLTVRGSFHGRVEERRWYLEATTGESLCGEPADAPRPLPTWTPGGAPPTPGPTATPAPTQGPPHP
jgi:hypothetical protein